VLWSIGAVMQGRIRIGEALLLACGALAMATSALGWIEWHRVFKPLAMVVALALVAGARPRGMRWLLAALAASLAGDVFLMFQGYFIPGLVAFLLAHLAYVALFRQDVAWLPSRGALLAVAAVGAVMYALLWFGGLPVGLRGPVAAYVLAIAL